MPRPVERDQRYIPGLDGLRAIAVLCVLAYHLGFGWAGGGMLGVGVFFTLSGYLITDLLLGHWQRFGSLGLRTFWLRRARRLLPALFLVIGVVSVYVALFDSMQLAEVRRQAVSAAFYFANWSTIATQGSYFGQFALPLPLDHLWSLSIEEQFYLVWPWLLGASILLMRGRRRMALLTLALAGLSAALMALLYHPGLDPTRVYEGTDTRAFGLLVGAALAMVLPTADRSRRGRRGRSGVLAGGRSRPPRPSRRTLDLLGLAGLIVIAVLVWRTTAFSAFLYPYGLLLLSLATAAVIAAVVAPYSVTGGVLGCAPLRWLGVRSYGIYLWQWPIVVLASSGHSTPRLDTVVPEVAATLLAAAVSWRWLEEPIRGGALGRLWRQARTPRPHGALRRVAAVPIAVAPAAAVVVVVGLLGWLPVAGSGSAASGSRLGEPVHGPIAGLRPGRSAGVYVTASASPAPLAGHGRGGILAVGSTEMLGARELLRHRLHARVDAVAARSAPAVITRLAQYRAARALPRTVIIQVGEDGPLSAATARQLRGVLRGVRRVVVVADPHQATWSISVDRELHSLVAHWRHAVVADPGAQGSGTPASSKISSPSPTAYVGSITRALDTLAARAALSHSAIQATVVSDSVAATILDVPQATAILARRLRLRLEMMSCRRLISPSCAVKGVTPPPALEAITTLGHAVGPVLVVDVGYNDDSQGYAHGIDQVMRAALAQGVRIVIWVNLRVYGGWTPVYQATNAAIWRAAARWPQLRVANWNRFSAGKSWFTDSVHPNAAGAVALARFLHTAITTAGR